MFLVFFCLGWGIWQIIKLEVVEYGGDLVKDESIFLKIIYFEFVICFELVCLILSGGFVIFFN